MKLQFENETFTSDDIGMGLQKYFIKVLAKARQHETFDELHLIISELQLQLIHTIILHTNEDHFPFTGDEVKFVMTKHMSRGKGMDINNHISEQYIDGGPLLHNAIADYWNECYRTKTIPPSL